MMLRVLLACVCVALQVSRATRSTWKAVEEGSTFDELTKDFGEVRCNYEKAMLRLKDAVGGRLLVNSIRDSIQEEVQSETSRPRYLTERYLLEKTASINAVVDLYRPAVKKDYRVMHEMQTLEIGYVESDFLRMLCWYFKLASFDETIRAIGSRLSQKIPPKVLANIFGDAVVSEAQEVAGILTSERELSEYRDRLKKEEGSFGTIISYIMLYHAIRLYKDSPTPHSTEMIEALMMHNLSAVVGAKSPALLQNIYANVPEKQKAVFSTSTSNHAMLVVVVRLGYHRRDHKKDLYRVFVYNSGDGIGRFHERLDVVDESGQAETRFAPFAVFDGLSWSDLASVNFYAEAELNTIYRDGKGLVHFKATPKNVVASQKAGTCAGMSLQFFLEYEIPLDLAVSDDLEDRLASLELRQSPDRALFNFRLRLALLEGSVDSLAQEAKALANASVAIDGWHDSLMQSYQRRLERYKKRGDLEDAAKLQRTGPMLLEQSVPQKTLDAKRDAEKNVELFQVFISAGLIDLLMRARRVFAANQDLARVLLEHFEGAWDRLSEKHSSLFAWEAIAASVESLFGETKQLVQSTERTARKKAERLSVAQQTHLSCLPSVGDLKSRNAVMHCILLAASTAGNSRAFFAFLDSFLEEDKMSEHEAYLLVLTAALSRKYYLVKRLVQEHGIGLYFPSVQPDPENELLLDDLERAPRERNAVQELAEYSMAIYGQPFEANPHVLRISARLKDTTVPLARLFGEQLCASNTPFDILRVFLLILNPVHASGIQEEQAAKADELELLDLVVGGVCRAPSHCGSLLSIPQRLLLEETIYRQSWTRKNAALAYRIFKLFEVPTFYKPDDAVACNVSLAEANFAEVLKREGQAAALASNIVACSDQSICRMTQNAEAMQTFDSDLRGGWKVGGNSLATARALVNLLNASKTTKKTLNTFVGAGGVKAVLERHYEWIAARIELPGSSKEDYVEAVIDLFPPIEKRPFAHYFVHVLLPSLHHLQKAVFPDDICKLFKAGAKDASLAAIDLEPAAAVVPELPLSLPLQIAVSEDAVNFVAQQVLHCPVETESDDKIDTQRLALLIYMAKMAKSDAVFSEILRLLGRVDDEYWQHPGAVYLALSMAFEQNYNSRKNKLAESIIVEKKLTAFPAVALPASTSIGSAPTISLGEVDSREKLEGWAQAHFYTHGYKWPTLASLMVPKIKESVDLEDQLLKHFKDLDKMHRFKLLVDLAAVSFDDEALSNLIGILCESGEEYCKLDTNKCAGFLVNAILNGRPFPNSGRRWRRAFSMTLSSTWLEPGFCSDVHRIEGFSRSTDLGRFKDEDELCQLACSLQSHAKPQTSK